MRRIAVAKVILTGVLVSGLLFALPNALSAQATNIAPTVIPLAGRFVLPTGQPRTGPVMLVLSLYESQDSLTPIWFERQQTTLDAAGRYEVQFGAAQDGGLPSSLFLAPTPKWIGVGVENEPEQPRAMLISVPYAARAASADTLGGRSVSDFVLAPAAQKDEYSSAPSRARDDRASAQSVTLNYLQKGDSSGGVTDSNLAETGGQVVFSAANTFNALRSATGVGSDNAGLFLAGGGEISSARTGWIGSFGINHAVAPGSVRVQLGSGVAAAHFRVYTGAAVPVLAATNEGRIGIGLENPAERLHAAGNILADGYLQSLTTVQSTTGNDLRLNANGVNRDVFLQVNGSTLATVHGSTGNMGIGTLNPTAKLHVVGNVVVDGNIGAKYQDIAEWVDASEPLYAGTIVTIDTSTTNRVKGATSAYDTRVAGAVSPQPGVVLGEPGTGKVLVAHSGRVRVKADARYGGIRPGDLLVSSPTKGHAMRSPASKARPGTVIGKALEALPNGRGEILALLTLQ